MDRERRGLGLILCMRFHLNTLRRLIVIMTYFLELLIPAILNNAAHFRPDTYCVLNADQQILRNFLAGTLDYKAHVRLTRDSFNVLESMLMPQSHGWDLSIRLLIFLFWLGCGTSYRVISCVFNVPRATIHVIVHSIMNEIIETLSHKVIKYPTAQEIDQVGRDFGRLANSAVFNGAVGAIDGCHVQVKVTGPNKQDYFDRKLNYSVQFQAVVDGKGIFIDVFAGYPGSVHDARVLRASSIYRERQYPPAGYFILGDGGYPLIERPITIITPFRNPHLVDEILFNRHHSSARNIVERAFGMLKARWRTIFLKTVEIKHTKVSRLIAVCCIMHNICVTLGDILQPIYEGDDNMDIDYIEEEDEEEAVQLRLHLARRLLVPEVMMEH